MVRPVIVLFAVATACSSHEGTASDPSRSASEGEGEVELTAKHGCGERSYGIHHNPGDSFEAIGARRVGAIACATPCVPTPGFARGAEGRNEHGGYGFIEIEPSACELPGTSLGVESCIGQCEREHLLGQLQIELADQTTASRERICRALEARWGPPDVGDCDCIDDEIVWLPRPDEPGAVLHFMGHYTLDCGFPPGNYAPEFSPG